MTQKATSRQVTYQEQQLLLLDENLLLVGPDAQMALEELDKHTVRHLSLYRGLIAEPRTIEVTAKIVAEPEYRYGFSGQLRERCASKTERIVETKPQLKLWHTTKKGWYWIQQ